MTSLGGADGDVDRLSHSFGVLIRACEDTLPAEFFASPSSWKSEMPRPKAFGATVLAECAEAMEQAGADDDLEQV